ncbi:hypothetical protein Tco_1116688 [Tanacetum coccineum]
MDAIALTPCYPAFLITADVPKVYMHQDIFQIYPRVHGREFDPLPSEEDTVSFLRELGHIGKINSLNDVVVNQMHQPWRTFAALINRSLSGKTCGLNKLRAIPPKISRKFKKASPNKKDSDLVPVDEPVTKGKRIKRSVKKSSTKPVTRIELLSKVALTKKAQLKEVRNKSLRDFHKTHPSGSGTVAEKPPSVEKITPTVTSEGTGDKPGVPDVTEDESTESESSEKKESDSKQDEESDDDDQEEEEVDQENESEDDEIESDEDKGMDDTTDQFDDDVDARLEESTQTGKEVVQGEGADVEMIDAQQGNENLETTQEQVVEDAHVTISTVTKKTEKSFLHLTFQFSMRYQILKLPHSFLYMFLSSQPLQTFTPPSLLSTPTPSPTTEATNPPTTLPDFASVFRFNDRITALEKEVVEIKKDPLHTQVTSLVDEHLDTRLGETIEEFINFLSESLTARIKEQVKDQLPQILPKEVSNFAPPMIEKLIKESRDEVTLAKVSSQSQSTYEAASTLTEFELKKILLNKMEKSESYLTAPKHRDCYDGLKKSYALDKDLFYSYDVYSLKRGRKDKDKDEDPSAGSDRGLKKRKTSKDAEPTTGQKKKDSTSGSSKGTKSQPKSSGKSVQSEEPVFEVADSDMPQDQEGNLGDNENEPRNETASRRDWFKKPTPPQEPTDPDWNIGKTTQEGPTQNWLMTLAASTSTDKSLKDFDELMSTPIDFSGYILNGLKIENLTQEILLGPAFRLLKGTRSNYAELEYDFEECYKALLEKLD